MGLLISFVDFIDLEITYTTDTDRSASYLDLYLGFDREGRLSPLLAATPYQGNPDRNHKHKNIVSTDRYILHIQVLLECCYI
jgi:hypothetical protein